MRKYTRNYSENRVDEHEWRWDFKLHGINYTVYVTYHPLVTENGYYAIGYLKRDNPYTIYNELIKKYGRSNYKNQLKYVLIAIKQDIEKLKDDPNAILGMFETEEFKKFIR